MGGLGGALPLARFFEDELSSLLRDDFLPDLRLDDEPSSLRGVCRLLFDDLSLCRLLLLRLLPRCDAELLPPECERCDNQSASQ